ncbi:CD99 antigen isoform X2 [Trichosurus vulpecula]|uniref:CD99 antigen isoform X2 n=1 Tax=Trichosurus vulpecula TaxID=9337 RepID=UPI00186AD5AB|nr:CD99 antigen isoform X2 [Trichosurus vulpecula]
MTMGRWPGIPLLLLLLVCTQALAQDFDLSDALPDEKPTKKPIPATKRPPSDGGLSLEDAVLSGGDDDPAKPNPPKPKPGYHGDTGGITDDDLNGHGHAGGSDDRSNDETPADSPGVISGIVSAAVVALVGAVSSFIAYQKKKLCFKGNDEQKI